MLKNRSSTLVFALAYVVFVAGVFLALGGAAYAADENPSSAADEYETKVQDVAVTGPSDPTDTGSQVADVAQRPLLARVRRVRAGAAPQQRAERVVGVQRPVRAAADVVRAAPVQELVAGLGRGQHLAGGPRA